jgi:xylulokinase
MEKLIAYDLGTGGIKASLFDMKGRSLASSFIPYETYYPGDRMFEQRPDDWWRGVCASTKAILEKSGVDPVEIACAALSGHSIVTVPVSGNGELLMQQVPIWCDMRASDETPDFFARIPYEEWYGATGAGDPPEGYSLFKLRWMKRHMPGVYEKTAVVLGSKDYINYKLTGVARTDPSYASSFGVFGLRDWDYREDYIEASGLRRSVFPEIAPSDFIIGKVTDEAASETGLVSGTPVACGGVDNMCMALGARGIEEGEAYTSLGTSSWIAVTSRVPVLDVKTLPFVYAHARKGYYTSAVSIFSAGNSYTWVRDTLFGKDGDYREMDRLAAKIPAGSGGVLFNPTLAGGSSQEKSPYTHGSYCGLSLGTTRGELIRAALEGVAMALRRTLDILKSHVTLRNEMLIVGGGASSPLWMQIFADIYNMKILKTNVDQDAASLGAAALAANACGAWDGYGAVPALHRREALYEPIPANKERYERLLEIYASWSDCLADVGEKMRPFVDG